VIPHIKNTVKINMTNLIFFSPQQKTQNANF